MGTPWAIPESYTIMPDPRSRFFDPTHPDFPTLPPAGPQLYQYELPELSHRGSGKTESLPPPLRSEPDDARELPAPPDVSQVGPSRPGEQPLKAHQGEVRLVSFQQEPAPLSSTARHGRKEGSISGRTVRHDRFPGQREGNDVPAGWTSVLGRRAQSVCRTHAGFSKCAGRVPAVVRAGTARGTAQHRAAHDCLRPIRTGTAQQPSVSAGERIALQRGVEPVAGTIRLRDEIRGPREHRRYDVHAPASQWHDGQYAGCSQRLQRRQAAGERWHLAGPVRQRCGAHVQRSVGVCGGH